MNDGRATKSPLRIAVVAACPFPSARGSQVLIRDLAQALADRGHDVHVVTYPFAEHLVAIRRIHVHRGEQRWWMSKSLPLVIQKFLLDLQLLGVLNRLVRDRKIDVIHAHNYEGPIISYVVRALRSVPVVYHSHNALRDELPWYVRGRIARRLAAAVGWILDRRVPRSADHVIALTRELEDCLVANGVDAKKVSVLPPSVPSQGDDDGAETPDDFEGRFVVMYSGNLDGYQDLGVLAAAFSEFRASAPDALLVLVTHESEWQARLGPRFEALRRRGSLRIVCAPSFSVARRLMRKADVLVCPRSSWSGYPIKLINYMNAARPIVVAAGSAKSLSAGLHARVFRNRDPRDLAAALMDLRNDPALRSRLAAEAKGLAESLPTSDEAASVIEGILEQLCSGNPRRSVPLSIETKRAEGLIAISRDRISGSVVERLG